MDLIQEFRKREEYINCQVHPTENLLIWNYNSRCQYDKAWDEYTIMARGLITDDKGNIIARPFKKFFNLGEIEEQKIPDGRFKVYEKFDGSLGILYWIKDIPYISTRGSFQSEQAIKGTEILHKLKEHWSWFNRDKTYLFEIIYPQNRIVIDYGKKEELVLLAIIDTKTGKNCYYNDIPFAFAKEVEGVKDFRTLTNVPKDNTEGFVIVWENGFRMKMKFEEYIRLHRLLTGFSTKSIWECLMNGNSINDMLKDVPDEFYHWARCKQAKLTNRYKFISKKAKKLYDEVKGMSTRKEQAMFILSHKDKFLSGIVFSILDNHHNVNVGIWKMIKPKYEQPFKTEV